MEVTSAYKRSAWASGAKHITIYFKLTWLIVSDIGPLSTAATKHYPHWTLFCNKKSVRKFSADFSMYVLQCGRIIFGASAWDNQNQSCRKSAPMVGNSWQRQRPSSSSRPSLPRPEWKILPTRTDYCSNTKWDRYKVAGRFFCAAYKRHTHYRPNFTLFSLKKIYT